MKATQILALSLFLLMGCTSTVATTGRSQTGPFKTSADQTLQRDIIANLLMFNHLKFPNCTDVKPTAAIVINTDQDKRVITEEWTLSSCGNSYIYKVQLLSSPEGGTDISIEMGPDNPRLAA
jgi:hypothetical protein